MTTTTIPLGERHYVVSSAGCWEWRGAKKPCGYGRIKRRGKYFIAHRVMYEQRVGPIPEGMHVHHTCHNRGCINPDHLDLIVPQEHPRKHGKLKPEQIERLRATKAKGGNISALAREFGVAISTARYAATGKSWS